MRMTNKIMQNNSLYNINQSKINEDKYNTQMGSQSKINRPSDDPVVAIRALSLRTSVSDLTQYYEKNAPDASNWISVTAKSLDTVTSVLKSIYSQATKGSNEDLTCSDLQTITDQMNALTTEFYATGNADYAGRYVFTGYRTDTPLSYTEDTTQQYNITEPLDKDDMSTISYTNYSALTDNTDSTDDLDTNITNTTLYRVRLSYNGLDSDYTTAETPPTTQTPSLTVTDNTTMPATTETYPTTAYASAEEAYKAISEDTTGTLNAFVPSTGEIILNKTDYDAIQSSLASGDTMSTTYSKTDWSKGDLVPQHYFECTSNGITYNDADAATGRTSGDASREIYYDVGYNQNIQVNTNGNEVFTPDLQRDADDLNNAMSDLTAINKTVTELKTKLSSLSSGTTDYETTETKLEAANKAYQYLRENVQTLMEKQVSNYQTYNDQCSVAITENGTRSTRLNLIKTRLMSQQSTFKDLQQSNEGIDMSTVAVQLASAELTYEASLKATSKILQNSLMNYI